MLLECYLIVLSGYNAQDWAKGGPHNRDNSIFWRVIIPNGIYSESFFFFFILKGHYSENFYPEGSLFGIFYSKGSLSKDFYPEGLLFRRFLSRVRNNDPSGYTKIFGILTLRNKNPFGTVTLRNIDQFQLSTTYSVEPIKSGEFRCSWEATLCNSNI